MKILSYFIFGMPFIVQPSLHSQAWGYVHKSEDVYDMPCLYTEANNIRLNLSLNGKRKRKQMIKNQ